MMGKVDLAAAILELSMKETSSKFLEERLSMSTKVLDEQLGILASKHLIRISKTDKKVRITKRGTKFLELYKSIRARYLTVPA